jgi:hypothetical protein
VVYFKLAQDDKHVYVPSEEKVMEVVESIDAFMKAARKGWKTDEEGQARPPEKTHLLMLMIDVKLDDKKKDMAAKMLLFHLALIMSKLDMECDDVCLMGGMCEFKSLFGRLNAMVDLLK